MKVNIPKSNTDTFFRYKRDEIDIKVVNTNGGNTDLTNIITISEQLGDDVDFLIKFIKKKLNVNIITKNNKYVINKIIVKDNIENILEEYIKKNILCPGCSNPEFTREITKKKEIRTCKACGVSREI